MSTKVCVMLRANRRFYEAQWKDPITGKKKTRSLKTSNRREAEREAARIEDDVSAGQLQPDKVLWSDVVSAYKAEKFPEQSDTSRSKVNTALKHFHEFVCPRLASSIREQQIRQYRQGLTRRCPSTATVASHMRELRKVIRWAHRQGLMSRAPVFEMPKASGIIAKGRALTECELARFRVCLASIVGPDVAPSWDRFVMALWWGGFRITEAVNLSWTSPPIRILWGQDRWLMEAYPEADKKRQHRLSPLAPQFVAMLQDIPLSDRVGNVIAPEPLRGEARLSSAWIGKKLSGAGKRANIIVGSPGGKTKYASAHDLRRSFGERWAAKLAPAVLQQLMRHGSIVTTMTFYAGRDATVAADAIYEASK